MQVDDDAYCDVSSLTDLGWIGHDGREAVRDHLQAHKPRVVGHPRLWAERDRPRVQPIARCDDSTFGGFVAILGIQATKVGHMPVAWMGSVGVWVVFQFFNCDMEKPPGLLPLYGGSK